MNKDNLISEKTIGRLIGANKRMVFAIGKKFHGAEKTKDEWCKVLLSEGMIDSIPEIFLD